VTYVAKIIGRLFLEDTMRRLLPLTLLSLVLFSGCFPHTKSYQPVSTWEKQNFEQANRNIFPDDVRTDLPKLPNIMLVWPGAVLESKFIEHTDQLEIQFTLEHHYYDWLEDYSIQKEIIFPSPKGEGIFRTSWFMKKASAPGNLIIVYGKPKQINDDKSITLTSTYIRGIDKQWYRTDMLDYGRPGQPVKMLKAQPK
jgi:hypothetical protein